MAVWYSLWSFGIFFPFWNVLTKKNLATLDGWFVSKLTAASKAVFSRRAPTQPVNPMMKVMAPEKINPSH
jgi:hypothetical protein